MQVLKMQLSIIPILAGTYYGIQKILELMLQINLKSQLE